MKGATPSGPSVLISIRQIPTAAACAGSGNRPKPLHTATIAPGRTYWPPIPTTIASTTDVVTRGDGSFHAVNRRLITSPARTNEPERKKIHAKQTTLKVRTRPNH